MKRISLKNISFFIFLLLFSFTFLSYGDKNQDLQNINSEINNIQQEIVKRNKKLSLVNQNILDVDNKISIVENNLYFIKDEIVDTEKRIKENQKKIDKIKDKIGDLRKNVENRIRVMSKVNNMDYIEIVLSSKDVKEIFSNYNIMKRIVKKDKEDLELLTIANSKLMSITARLKMDKENLESYQGNYNSQKNILVGYKEKQKNNLNALSKDIKSLREIENLKKIEADNLKEEIRLLELKAKSENIDSELFYKKGNGKLANPLSTFKITSGFGNRVHPILKSTFFHTGIDLAEDMGANVFSADDGIVIYAAPKGTYGNLIIVKHNETLTTVYGHLSSFNVKAGDAVKRGQIIGKVGSTGRSTGPHLHFEVRVNGNYVNPLEYL